MKLETTDTQLHALQSTLDATRETSTTCKVPKDALRALILDHFTLYQAATGPVHKGGKGHTVAVGPDQESMA